MMPPDLVFGVHSGGPDWLDEDLSVEGTGCRYDLWAASAPTWLTRAGRFEAEIDGPLADRLARLAADLCSLENPPPPLEGQLAVQASAAGRHVHVGLSGPVPTRPLSTPEAEARDAFAELAARCRPGGVVALELAASLAPGTRGPEGPSSARLELRNIGRDSAAFWVEPTSVAVSWQLGSGEGSAAAGPGLILTGDSAAYLDGIRAPAHLAPGEAARLALVDVLPFAAFGAGDRLSAVLRGRLVVDGHEVPFRLQA